MKNGKDELILSATVTWTLGIFLIAITQDFNFQILEFTVGWSIFVLASYFLLKKMFSPKEKEDREIRKTSTTRILRGSTNAISIRIILVAFTATVHVAVARIIIKPWCRFLNFIRKYWDICLIQSGILYIIFLRFSSDIHSSESIMMKVALIILILVFITVFRARASSIK